MEENSFHHQLYLGHSIYTHKAAIVSCQTIVGIILSCQYSSNARAISSILRPSRSTSQWFLISSDFEWLLLSGLSIDVAKSARTAAGRAGEEGARCSVFASSVPMLVSLDRQSVELSGIRLDIRLADLPLLESSQLLTRWA